MLGQRRHLRTLQMRVGRHDRLQMVAGTLEQHLLQAGDSHVLTLGHAPQMQSHVGDHLVVTAAAGMELGAGLTDELRKATLDGHMHVFVGIGRHELAGLDLAGDGCEAILDGGGLSGAQHPGALQSPGVSHGALDVFGPQAPIERQRGVERHESWGALAREPSRARNRHRVPPVFIVVVMLSP